VSRWRASVSGSSLETGETLASRPSGTRQLENPEQRLDRETLNENREYDDPER
jgi:hypothetical protein